jgi:hypothetical protein
MNRMTIAIRTSATTQTNQARTTTTIRTSTMPTDQARTTTNQTRVTGMMNPMTTKVEETKGAALVEQTKEKGKQSLKTFVTH